jgi:hypothetical protein
MIPKSVKRFSEKIMLKRKNERFAQVGWKFTDLSNSSPRF